MNPISTLLNCILTFAICFGLSAQTQTVFEVLFDNGFPTNTTIIDQGAQEAHSLLEDCGFGKKSSWLTTQSVIKDGKNGISNGVAIATSRFGRDKIQAADNYLVFGGITIPTNTPACYLQWDALSLDSVFMESYELYVVEGSVSTAAQILQNTPVAVIKNEKGATVDPTTLLFNNWQNHNVDLSAWIGKKISLVFRLNTPSGFLLLLDNVRILATQQKPISSPQAETIKISGLDKGGATIRWSKTPEATSYLVSVFSRSVYGDQRTYLFERKETDKLGVSIATLPQDKQFFVTLSAKRAEEVSNESTEVPIVASLDRNSIPIPQGLELVDTTDKIYTIGWQAVPIASAYEAYAYTHEIAQADGVYVLRESFDAIPEGTLDSPVEMPYGGVRIDDYCQTKGWGGNVLALAKGAVVIKNRFKGFNWSYFDCPTMTLGNDRSGEFSVDVTAVSQVGDSVELKLYQHVAGKNSVSLLETVRQIMTQERETLRFNFSKGRPNSFISIEVHTFKTENALIDELVFSRPMKKDEEMKLLRSLIETQDIKATFPERPIAVDHGYYSFSVASRAIYRKPIISLPATEVYSQGNPRSIKPINQGSQGCNWQITPQGLHIYLPSRTSVGLYTMTGLRLYFNDQIEGYLLIPLSDTDKIYLLRIGSDTAIIARP